MAPTDVLARQHYKNALELFKNTKINKTYSHILNNIPTNEKPFDDILNLRTNEIKQSYNNYISEIQKLPLHGSVFSSRD